MRTYGLWKESAVQKYVENENKEGRLRPGSGVTIDKERPNAGEYPYVHCRIIKDKAYAEIAALIYEESEDKKWKKSYNCTSYADEIFTTITNVNLDTDGTLWAEYPSELGESIQDINGGKNSNLPEDLRDPKVEIPGKETDPNSSGRDEDNSS